jgi:TRAP-type C4-dicarboxylate transport system permease small subunit
MHQPGQSHTAAPWKPDEICINERFITRCRAANGESSQQGIQLRSQQRHGGCSKVREGVMSAKADASSTRSQFGIMDRWIHLMALWSDRLSALICAVLIVTTTGTMVVYQFGIVVPWLDDVLRLLLIWLVYLGAVSLCLRNDHISMDAIYLMLPVSVRRVIDVFIALLAIGLCGFVTKIGYDSMMLAIQYGQLLPSGYLPAWPQSLAIPLGFGLMAVAYLSYLLSLIGSRRLRPLGEAERLSEGA